jgi:hypothetical protein
MQQNKKRAILTHRITMISRSNKSRIALRVYENVSAKKHKHCGTRRVGESFIAWSIDVFWRADRTGSRLFKMCSDFVLYNEACQKPKVKNENNSCLLLIKKNKK